MLKQEDRILSRCSHCKQRFPDYEMSTSPSGIFGHQPRFCHRCGFRNRYIDVWREQMKWAGASMWQALWKHDPKSDFLALYADSVDPSFGLHVNLDKDVWVFRKVSRGKAIDPLQGQGLEALERELILTRESYGKRAAKHKALGGLITLRKPLQYAAPDKRK